jgi:hypothetical protein
MTKPPRATAGREPRSEATLSLPQALSRSKPLARLAERLRESEARCTAIRPLLPAALAAQVRPGPLDESGWSLLVAHAAGAAKLRQLEPFIEQALADAGFAALALRIKVQAG